VATYVIGDVQGCFASLVRLLEQIAFDPAGDRVWLVGDLVNRGPDDLGVLRWASGLGDRVVAVLGNHDLHLLCVAVGQRKLSRKDTFQTVLEAPDREPLLAWLRGRPLLYAEGRHLLVHAGLLPQWSEQVALAEARAIEEVIQRGSPDELGGLVRSQVHTWDPAAPRRKRLGAALAAFTRLRTCTPGGRMAFGFKGPPSSAPAGHGPWFVHPHRRDPEGVVLFGHWAALGLHLDNGVVGLDTGCVWGRELTAYRLEDGRRWSQGRL
jgi:bis(5'-nucleosyl)-tetraphosphatase (symmetrical)